MPTYKVQCETCEGVKDSRAKSCSNCRLKNNHPRKGTRKEGKELKKKYRFIKTPEGTKYEHRLIMEAHLNRKLETHEIVHHVNGDGLDNSIENLEITTREEHLSKHLKDDPEWMQRFSAAGTLARWGK